MKWVMDLLAWFRRLQWGAQKSGLRSEPLVGRKLHAASGRKTQASATVSPPQPKGDYEGSVGGQEEPLIRKAEAEPAPVPAKAAQPSPAPTAVSQGTPPQSGIPRWVWYVVCSVVGLIVLIGVGFFVAGALKGDGTSPPEPTPTVPPVSTAKVDFMQTVVISGQMQISISRADGPAVIVIASELPLGDLADTNGAKIGTVTESGSSKVIAFESGAQTTVRLTKVDPADPAIVPVSFHVSDGAHTSADFTLLAQNTDGKFHLVINGKEYGTWAPPEPVDIGTSRIQTVEDGDGIKFIFPGKAAEIVAYGGGVLATGDMILTISAADQSAELTATTPEGDFSVGGTVIGSVAMQGDGRKLSFNGKVAVTVSLAKVDEAANLAPVQFTMGNRSFSVLALTDGRFRLAVVRDGQEKPAEYVTPPTNIALQDYPVIQSADADDKINLIFPRTDSSNTGSTGEPTATPAQ